MNFAFNEEQDELRRMVNRFLQEKSPETEVRRLMATSEGYDPAVWSQMAEQLERDQQGEQFRVLDPANLPDKPSFPNRPMFALGGLGGGLALGLGLAFLMEMKDSSFKNERDVEVALQLPVLAMIPAVESLSSKKTKLRAGHDPVEASVEVGAGA